MKRIKRTLLAVAISTLFAPVWGQYEAAIFDYQNAYFNNGQPLKPESDLLVSGNIGKEIQRVEFMIYDNMDKDKRPLYSNVWKRSYGNSQENFQIPVTYPLRGNANYDIIIDYYREVTPEEREMLQNTLIQLLDKYVEESFVVQKWHLRPTRSHKTIVNELNHLVFDMLYYYRNDTEIMFTGFSDMIAESLKPLRQPRLHNEESIEFASLEESSFKKSTILSAVYRKRMEDLKEILRLEVTQMMSTHLVVRSDCRRIKAYETEREQQELAINAGYGGLYLGDYQKDFTFAGAPYVGISIPFGNSSFAGRFWSNTSLSIGAFVGDVKRSNAEKITGPLFGKPAYLGLGYKMFNIARLNVGASAIGTGNAGSIANRFQVKPFVGVSAEINFSMRMGRKHKSR